MATFYVLPPRECLEHATAEFLARVLPGVPVPPNVSEALLGLLGGREVYFVHREDLPGGSDLADELAAGFGAEPGDTVVEIGLPTATAAARVRRWAIPAAVPESPAGR